MGALAEEGGMTLLASTAATYARNGVAIFPVVPRGKLPLIPRCPNAVDDDREWLRGADLEAHAAACDGHGHGFYDATDDLAVVEAWWAQWPDANIGISLGANGIWVLDVDGPDGAALLRRLEDENGAIVETYEVITGRAEGAGRHCIFRQPSDGRVVRNGKPWGATSKLEVKGAGGYVIAPPSIHESGRAYLAHGKWSQIVEADDWLLAAVLKEDRAEQPRAPRKPYDSSFGPDGTAYGLAALRGELDYVAETFADGNRHWPGIESSGRVASLINGGELPGSAAQEWVAEAVRCGMPQDEAEAMIRGALGKGWSRTPDPLAPQVPTLVDAPAGAGWEEGDTGEPEATDPLSRWVADIRARATAGGAFLAKGTGPIPAIWGEEGSDEVLWAQGEGLLVAGGPGTGKSTLVQQVVAGRLGHPDFAEVLGHPVQAGERGVLYLALDRPRQIARSLNRMLRASDGCVERLVVWDEPIPFDPAAQRDALSLMCQALDCATVVIDSLYDLHPAMVDPKIAGEVVRCLKVAINDGIDLVAIHHPRKAASGAKASKPHLDDLYGGMQLGAGFGSVLHISGQAGDLAVTVHHLKQPGAVIGPLEVTHDHEAGRSSAAPTPDVMELVRQNLSATAQEAAIHLYGESSKAGVDKARRRLEALVRKGLLESTGDGRTGVAKRYLLAGPKYVPMGGEVL